MSCVCRERGSSNGPQADLKHCVRFSSVFPFHAASPRTTCERHLVPPWILIEGHEAAGSIAFAFIYQFYCRRNLMETKLCLVMGKGTVLTEDLNNLGSVPQVVPIAVAP